jgi:phage gpG-like protein
MVTISISIPNAGEFSSKLKKIGVDLMDFSEELRTVGAYLTNYFSTVPFDTQGRNYGGWAPLQQRTLNRKVRLIGRLGYGVSAHDILQLSGRMRKSFQYQSSRDSLTVSNAVPYFKYHQSFLPRKSNLPQRIMMAIDAQNKAQIVSIIETGIQNRINLVK